MGTRLAIRPDYQTGPLLQHQQGQGHDTEALWSPCPARAQHREKHSTDSKVDDEFQFPGIKASTTTSVLSGSAVGPALANQSQLQRARL